MFRPDLRLVIERDGHFYTDSHNVADVFQKQHGHVLRDIDLLIKASPDLDSLYFQRVISFDQKANRNTPGYEISRDGLTLLVMSYTGEKAMRFKLAYIERFNAMEREIASMAPSSGAESP